jgi:hypothetical protein
MTNTPNDKSMLLIDGNYFMTGGGKGPLPALDKSFDPVLEKIIRLTGL